LRAGREIIMQKKEAMLVDVSKEREEIPVALANIPGL